MTLKTVRRRRYRFPQRPNRQRVSREQADFTICDYFETLDCARALTCWLLYKHGEHRQLVDLKCNPTDFNTVGSFRAAYAATKFLSKCVGLKTNIDLKGVALKSAEEAEQLNRDTNAYIIGIRNGHVSDLYGSEIFRAMKKIANILGPCPEAFDDGGWSGGRSSSSFGETVTGYHKYRSSPDVTVKSRLRAMRLLNGSWWWGAAVLHADAPTSVLPRALNIIQGNTLITVPKSAKTDRVICYEPHMNIRLQLAVGDYLRHRLSRAGINLNDQSINRRRAKFGSIHGSMSTIDLKSASDTLARELVWELLPYDWACLLDDLRSHYTLWPDGSWRRNEKFSSMGNGFTFELESLIFYALASVVTGNVSVYGDDIIVPTESFSQVARLLTACGFRLNTEKSFSSGWFRESCGGDYFGGVDCTPVYLRKIPKTSEDIMKIHNQVRRYASISCEIKWRDVMRKWRMIYPGHLGPSGQHGSLDPKYVVSTTNFGQYFHLRDVKRHFRKVLNWVSLGDGHYHVNQDEALPCSARFWNPDKRSYDRYTGLDGWVYKTRVTYTEPAVSLEHYAPAICVATGPKRTMNLLSAAHRQVTKYKDIWGQAIEWPDVCWV